MNNSMILEKEFETAIYLARKAGAAILEFYKTDVVVEEKIQADDYSEPVTIADKTASQIIVEGLSAAFPNDGILSEEEVDDKERLDKKRIWVIDPLDGTLGFINKNGDFAVQIGLAENGEAILGVVFKPTENVLYFASKGNGAWMIKDGNKPTRLEASRKTDFTEMGLAVSRNHRSPAMTVVVERLGLKKEIGRGSVGLKIGLIVEQFCDLYIHLSPRTKHWDSCAPEIILREAGGQMTDLFGEQITYNTLDVNNHNGILATNGAVHDLAVSKLKPLLTEFGRVKVLSAK